MNSIAVSPLRFRTSEATNESSRILEQLRCRHCCRRCRRSERRRIAHPRSSLHSKGANEMTPNRLTRDNAVLLLVDHQVGLYTGIRDIDILTLKHNIVGLTKAMLALKVPVIVTTTSENMWGPLIPELADVLRGAKTIERTTVNAWDEKRVSDAVK